MPSNFIKIVLAVVGLSPALFLLYIVKIISDFSKLKIYIHTDSVKQTFYEIGNFLQTHYLLILFILFIVVARYIVHFAKQKFAVGRIEVKSVKPGDTNFMSVIFSAIPLLIKLYSPNISDWILVSSFFAIGVVLGLSMKSSYHFNLVLKLILGYSHYEVQTKEEVTYLMLSKKQLINRKEITKYVKIGDHMLLNVSDKP